MKKALTKLVKSQSILEYLIVLTAIVFAIIVGTIGPVGLNRGIQSSLDQAQEDIEDELTNEYHAPAGIQEERYYSAPQEDMFEEVLQNHGLTHTHKEEYTPPLKTERCPRCNTFVAKEDKHCSQCWFILDEEEALKHEEAQKKPMEMINKILEFLTKKLGPEGLEDLFKELQ